MAPRTALGKVATILYALLGIPLMLLYLSSVGSTLSLGLRRALAGKCPCHDPAATVEEPSSSGNEPPFYLYNNVASSAKPKPATCGVYGALIELKLVVW
ncbi:hypothetical protein B566_EDAN015750 [Ephemera danica]|nr:hypothetical protein B566_EDAN015750 [Ephemera danica]